MADDEDGAARATSLPPVISEALLPPLPAVRGRAPAKKRKASQAAKRPPRGRGRSQTRVSHEGLGGQASRPQPAGADEARTRRDMAMIHIGRIMATSNRDRTPPTRAHTPFNPPTPGVRTRDGTPVAWPRAPDALVPTHIPFATGMDDGFEMDWQDNDDGPMRTGMPPDGYDADGNPYVIDHTPGRYDLVGLAGDDGPRVAEEFRQMMEARDIAVWASRRDAQLLADAAADAAADASDPGDPVVNFGAATEAQRAADANADYPLLPGEDPFLDHFSNLMVYCTYKHGHVHGTEFDVASAMAVMMPYATSEWDEQLAVQSSNPPTSVPILQWNDPRGPSDAENEFRRVQNVGIRSRLHQYQANTGGPVSDDVLVSAMTLGHVMPVPMNKFAPEVIDQLQYELGYVQVTAFSTHTRGPLAGQVFERRCLLAPVDRLSIRESGAWQLGYGSYPYPGSTPDWRAGFIFDHEYEQAADNFTGYTGDGSYATVAKVAAPLIAERGLGYATGKYNLAGDLNKGANLAHKAVSFASDIGSRVRSWTPW